MGSNLLVLTVIAILLQRSVFERDSTERLVGSQQESMTLDETDPSQQVLPNVVLLADIKYLCLCVCSWKVTDRMNVIHSWLTEGERRRISKDKLSYTTEARKNNLSETDGVDSHGARDAYYQSK